MVPVNTTGTMTLAVTVTDGGDIHVQMGTIIGYGRNLTHAISDLMNKVQPGWSDDLLSCPLCKESFE